jgi:hypothetical protein
VSQVIVTASKTDHALSTMKPKFLLLAFTVGTWIVADAVCWWLRPQGPTWPPAYLDFYRAFALNAVWLAQAQLGGCLIPLLGSRPSKWAIVSVLLVISANCVQMWFPTNPVDDRQYEFQLAILQVTVLLPIAALLRSQGLRVTHTHLAPATLGPSVRQFGLSTLMLYTAGSAVLCLLIGKIELHRFDASWGARTIEIVTPACIAVTTLWVALRRGRLLLRSAALVGLLALTSVGVAAILNAFVFNSFEISASEIFPFFGGPTLFVWLTGVTLRSFGWRLVWQRAQPASSELFAVPSEIA